MDIEIRRSQASDAMQIRDVYACTNVYSNTLQLPFPSADFWQKRVTNVDDNCYPFVALIDGEIIGHIVLHVSANPRRRHVALFGMSVKHDYSGLGVGSKLLSTIIDLADNWLNLSRIELTVYTDNQAAIGLYKKFGFVIEGESAAYAYRNGEYASAYHMARFKS
ncbi:GNAT family N-acetyltransferase [Vibrio aquimaris]|uniref:Spermidine N(1)-acetyltransferase n=1 Tax=Vibrio aquimaris TaxID=2587862 RepID=A0A5P9CQR6_9VIBR|nr:GNAT family N-acetyltransferase [Vibrio aquimaris]QFT28605.1 Spermidine N(1)-acetyltransferase [Vibrio aquimaris]